MVQPILDMNAVGAAHPKWVRSQFNEGTNYAYQKNQNGGIPLTNY